MVLRLAVPAAMLLAVLLSGCPEGTDPTDESPRETDTRLARWPSNVLPFALAPTVEGRKDSGAIVGRDVAFDVSFDGSTSRWQSGVLATVAALPDRIAVVFPPAGRTGFDIAHAALDEPWVTVPLTDLPVDQVGAIASTNGPDGRLWVALRRRSGAQELELFSWRRGEQPTHETVPRLGLSASHAFHDRCDDLTMAVAGDGTIELVYQQVAPGAQGDSWVMRSYRPPGGDWRHEPVAYAADFPAPPDAREMNEIGCRNVLALDESDQPVVMTLVRRIYKQSLQAEMSSQPIGSMHPWIYGRDGRGIWRLQDSVELPDHRRRAAVPNIEPWDETERQYTPQFDLAAHPQGFLVATSFPNSGGVRVRLEAGSLRRDAWPGWNAPELEFKDLDAARGRIGGALGFEPCGGPMLVQAWTDSAGTRLGPLMSGFSRCQFSAPRAPVAGRWEFDGYSAVVPARGRKLPYLAMLCASEAKGLAICGGGHTGQGTRGEPPFLVSSNVEDEARVGADFVWDVTLSRPPAANERVHVNVVDTLARALVFPSEITEGPEPGRLRIKPKELSPGGRYRLEVSYSDNESLQVESWQFAGQRVPGVTVEVEPVALQPDPRTETIRWPCESFPETYRRGSEGVCEYVHEIDPRPGNSAPLRLRVDAWHGKDRFQLPTPPWLEDAQGKRVEFAVARRHQDNPKNAYENMVWSQLLEEYATYTVVFPSSTRSEAGGPLDPNDLRMRFRTRAQPPYVKQTVPAHLATGVDPAAPIDVQFNTRTVINTGAVRLEDATTFTEVALSALQVDNTTWRFLHAPLARRTEYRLILTDRISDEYSVALQHAPVTTLFTTAP